MLTDVGRDIGLSAGDLPQRFDDFLGLDQLAVAVVAQAIIRFPLSDLLPPRIDPVAVGTLVGLAQRFQDIAQHDFDVTDDRDVHFHVLGDRSGVDVDVNDFGARAELFDVAGDAVVEARAHREQHIAFVHGHVGLVRAVHAKHADKLGIGAGIGAQTHQRVGDRVTQRLRDFGQLLRSLAENHAPSGVNHRPLRRHQQIDGFTDLPGMPFEHGIVGAQIDALGVFERDLDVRRRDVFGNIDHHRPRAARRRQVESLFDRRRDFLDALGQEIVFDARTRDADRIDFLKRIAADKRSRDLPGQHYHRNRIQVRRGDPGHGIGGTRSRGNQHDAGFPRGAGVAIGGMSRPLFVAYENVLDVFLLIQRIVNMQYRTARIAEQILNTFAFKRFDNDFRTRQFHDVTPSFGSSNTGTRN